MQDIGNAVYSRYARIINETDNCHKYSGIEWYHLFNVRERQFTELLRTQGYVLLNDVYESLGLSRVQEYDNVGWLYNEENPVGDNFIEFGISNLVYLVNDVFDYILIDFNVDGVIRY